MGITEADLAKWAKFKSKMHEGNICFGCMGVDYGYIDRFISFVQGSR